MLLLSCIVSLLNNGLIICFGTFYVPYTGKESSKTVVVTCAISTNQYQHAIVTTASGGSGWATAQVECQNFTASGFDAVQYAAIVACDAHNYHYLAIGY